MKLCLTRTTPLITDLTVDGLAAELTKACDDVVRADLVLDGKLLTLFRGDPNGISADLRYDGHRLNARVPFQAIASLVTSSDPELWLRARDAVDEDWNLENDRDYIHALDLLGDCGADRR